MVKSSSSSKNEVFDDSFCSTSCKKNTESLNTKITELSKKLSDSKTMLYHYKLGTSQVEARLVEFKNQEIKFYEKIKGLEFNVECKNNRIERLTNELEELKKEKEGLETKLTVYSPPKKDMSLTGLPEFADDTKMVKSSSSSKNEVFDDSFCSTSCKKNTKSLNTKITELSKKLSDNKTIDDESLSDEDVLKDNVKIYLNHLFEFDDEYISSDVNPLFDEVLENIESKDSYDEPDLLVTPLFDANKDECFDSGGDDDEINILDYEDSYYDSE
nr:hypothetical protein [Tanacetum cinerariifolium]